MKKYIKTIALTVVCLLLSVVVFASCGGNGVTYAGTFYEDDGKTELSFVQKSDNSFSLINKVYDGDKTVEISFYGKFTMNKDKADVEEVQVSSASMKVFVNGKLTDSEDIDDEFVSSISDSIKLKIGKGYVVFADSYILYKNGAKKLANNEILKVLTEKDYPELDLSKTTREAYEADFYVLKNEETPGEKLKLGVLYSHFDFCKLAKTTVTKVDGLDTSKLGKQEVTITYDIDALNLKDQTLKASIMVVENEKQLPENLIEETKIEIDGLESNYVEMVQGDNLTNASVVLKYCTKSDKDPAYTYWRKLELTSDTLEEFKIEGLDNTKLGFQEVTITHVETGASAKITVNVIDPKTPKTINVYGSVKIKSNKTLDLSEAKYTITYIDGTTSDEFVLTEDDIILQGAIADYVDGDNFVFKVSVKVEDRTLVYYPSIDIVIETA